MQAQSSPGACAISTISDGSRLAQQTAERGPRINCVLAASGTPSTKPLTVSHFLSRYANLATAGCSVNVFSRSPLSVRNAASRSHLDSTGPIGLDTAHESAKRRHAGLTAGALRPHSSPITKRSTVLPSNRLLIFAKGSVKSAAPHQNLGGGVTFTSITATKPARFAAFSVQSAIAQSGSSMMIRSCLERPLPISKGNGS